MIQDLLKRGIRRADTTPCEFQPLALAPLAAQIVAEFETQAKAKDMEIIDQGIGIPESKVLRLFTEFFRAENAKTFTDRGTGLGLVIAKESMDRLHGTIRIQSREGEGTQVTCRFPIHSNSRQRQSKKNTINTLT